MTNELITIMQNNAKTLLTQLIIDEVPFNLIIHQNDDWDNKLPDEMIKQFPETLTLSISDEVFDHIEWDNEDPRFTMMFGEGEYSKTIYASDILAIVDTSNQPMLINRIPKAPKTVPETTQETTKDEKYIKPKNKEDWVKEAIKDGISVLNAETSINAFMKNNKDLFKKD